MPESVKDRCTKSHEYIFLMTKNPTYYYDNEAIKEDVVNPNRKNYQSGSRSFGLNSDRNDNDLGERSKNIIYSKKNKRSVWTVALHPFKDAHFAVFPPDLIEPMVLAGCPEKGIVLDPFMGSGTTGVVAQSLGRSWIGCELNPEYVEMQRKRTSQQSLF